MDFTGLFDDTRKINAGADCDFFALQNISANIRTYQLIRKEPNPAQLRIMNATCTPSYFSFPPPSASTSCAQTPRRGGQKMQIPFFSHFFLFFPGELDFTLCFPVFFAFFWDLGFFKMFFFAFYIFTCHERVDGAR